jgi:serine protease inhibitor
MIRDVSATSSVMSKVFEFGKTMLEKRKKKKHDKLKAVSDDHPL